MEPPFFEQHILSIIREGCPAGAAFSKQLFIIRSNYETKIFVKKNHANVSTLLPMPN